MHKSLFIGFLILAAATFHGAEEKSIPPIPAAVSSNAVASVKGGLQIISMMGVGPRKTWDDITNQIYVLDLIHPKWTQGRIVPGVVGRLGATAVGARDVVVLMGGYMVDKDNNEITVPDVNVYEPDRRRWSRAEDIPIPVDSAVSGVTRNRYVYLIGGRSADGPVNNVQLYDMQTGTWSQATPFPGTPVFGLAGGIADENIVIADGAKPGPKDGPRYIASDECWLGKIDKKDPGKIEWTKLPAHPGTARFGIAAAGSDREHKIVFSGGTTTPHAFTGTAYDGQPSKASALTFAYDIHHHAWETLDENTTDPRADSRGLIFTPAGAVVLGGLNRDMAATAQATFLPTKRESEPK